jgi:hypothetical protein
MTGLSSRSTCSATGSVPSPTRALESLWTLSRPTSSGPLGGAASGKTKGHFVTSAVPTRSARCLTASCSRCLRARGASRLAALRLALRSFTLWVISFSSPCSTLTRSRSGRAGTSPSGAAGRGSSASTWLRPRSRVVPRAATRLKKAVSTLDQGSFAFPAASPQGLHRGPVSADRSATTAAHGEPASFTRPSHGAIAHAKAILALVYVIQIGRARAQSGPGPLLSRCPGPDGLPLQLAGLSLNLQVPGRDAGISAPAPDRRGALCIRVSLPIGNLVVQAAPGARLRGLALRLRASRSSCSLRPPLDRGVVPPHPARIDERPTPGGVRMMSSNSPRRTSSPRDALP